MMDNNINALDGGPVHNRLFQCYAEWMAEVCSLLGYKPTPEIGKQIAQQAHFLASNTLLLYSVKNGYLPLLYIKYIGIDENGTLSVITERRVTGDGGLPPVIVNEAGRACMGDPFDSEGDRLFVGDINV